jgi:hypothetical protein
MTTHEMIAEIDELVGHMDYDNDSQRVVALSLAVIANLFYHEAVSVNVDVRRFDDSIVTVKSDRD